ncbi:TPA: 3-methyl-2-oxobutanoate dehydrogenase (2-methylpropanoyl-transferring) subunit alpha [Candidatus Thalassarchaeaceae archaeon]|nr:3-methyl-2-oxobutanoate dehydrogenase (2-methylpropanoyl-transferring) subunit alpha [Euryarchaeota archaeon]DAC67061.1 MAG TPA: 3-methyl-2-oxobutanoate dehydrogenase (2-methylpropanoyl-transferring) subunit alpha [Candidatus Poseidoniales archaeon]HII43358.1 3-methyl-2-oxobutanoate dehydrogenase (2-methylpropanoyl-transferring) subunit alpha [Candidatus Thalassarchaeaceae archaeon]
MAAKKKQKSLQIPTAPFRPGDEANFDPFVNEPGDLPRPDPITCIAADTTDLANGLVRVLDFKGKASGPWDPQLTPDELRQGLEHMARMRIFDERMMKMQRTGKLSFYMRSLGEEAVAIAQTMALETQDWIFPSYRQPGAQFVRGRDMVSMINHCIGNVEDNVKGRQMPVHYTYKEGRFISISSPVGTQFSQAVGVAMASQYKGLDEVTITWIGDGASAEGDYHYALNFASVFKPPVILNIVNNQWAISTHRNIASGSPTFAARGLAYNVPCIRVDGNDFLALYSVTKWARERAAAGEGATHIEVLTYRTGAHSSSDDPSRYRPSDEAESWPGGDPIDRLAGHLIAIGEWSDKQQTEMEERIDGEVMAAYKEAVTHGDLANGPYPSADTIFTEVYETVPWHLQEQWDEMKQWTGD